MIEVPILKEIRSYESKLVGPFTLRQTVCAVVAIGGSYLMYTLQKMAGIEEPEGFFMLLGAVPGALLGWVKPYGLKFEVYMKSAFVDSVLAPTIRPYKPENPWYDMLKYRKLPEDSDDDMEIFEEETEENRKKYKASSKKKKVKKKELHDELQAGK